MEKYKIALLFGGRGLEHDVSVLGAKYAEEQLDRDIFDILPIFIDKGGEWLISRSKGAYSLENLSQEQAARRRVFPRAVNSEGGIMTEDGEFIKLFAAFPLLHGDFGEDGTVPGTLTNANIPYIGCDTVASSVCYDKVYTKVLAESLGIPSAKWLLCNNTDPGSARKRAESKLSYPMFLKPARLGSSFGASKVQSRENFAQAYSAAADLGGGRVLIEEFIPVEAELECGLFSTKSKVLFTKIGEIRYSSEFYDYNTKYLSDGIHTVTASGSLDGLYGGLIREYSERLSDLIGIHGIARIDFFLGRDGRILFNEINTMPGFTESSLYPAMLKESGLSVKEGLTELLLEAGGASAEVVQKFRMCGKDGRA